jgi:ABC-2 type transport system permease protein
MSPAVLGHALRQYRIRLLAVGGALAVWGLLMPVIYATFGVDLQPLIERFPAFDQMSRIMAGSLFTLSGWVALGLVHPISIALFAVFAIGFPLAAVAGERQRGTLEVVLARPLSRRTLYVTLLLAATLFVALIAAAALVGTVLSAGLMEVLDELPVANLPALWLNTVALYWVIAAISLAASVSYDRSAPAAAVALGIVLTSYSLQFIGSIWPDADWLQAYSIFHYLRAEEVLSAGLRLGDLLVLAAVGAIAVAYALIVFPRRDLAAPA